MYRTAYRTVGVNGLSVFYREAGPQDAPTILLLHGFPPPPRMWQPLLDRLADRFHLVAPDYPGFGHSDAPSHTEDIQTDLFYDYRTNVASYPAWQDWLRKRQPPLQAVWGRYDPSFQVGEAEAYRRDVPDAEVHVLDAGHFALDEQPDVIADLTRRFLLP